MKQTFIILLVCIIGAISCFDDLTPFIVGGRVAKAHSWPSQVLVKQSYETDFHFGSHGIQHIGFSFRCGGTLLNGTHILTAAHCVAKELEMDQFGQTWKIPIVPNKYFPSYESMYTIYAGAHDVTFTTDNTLPIPDEVTVLQVEKINVHPLYNEQTHLNDLALMRLTTVVEETKEIKYAYLPPLSTSIPSEGEVGTVIGWGTTEEGGDTSDVLLQVSINILNMNRNCRLYRASSTKQICAGYLPGGKDSCQGDSGGGFYTLDKKTNRWMTVGVVSYGVGCARPRIPGIYVRISAYMDWIRDLKL